MNNIFVWFDINKITIYYIKTLVGWTQSTTTPRTILFSFYLILYVANTGKRAGPLNLVTWWSCNLTISWYRTHNSPVSRCSVNEWWLLYLGEDRFGNNLGFQIFKWLKVYQYDMIKFFHNSLLPHCALPLSLWRKQTFFITLQRNAP
jgi:hypothetical protein